MHFHCIGVTPTWGTLRFLLLPWWSCTTWSLSPISSCVLSPLLIICLTPLVPSVISPCCAAWDSSEFVPPSFCWMVGLLLVLGMWCRYIYCGRGVVAVVLGMLCGVVVVGSKGGVLVFAWTSWRFFLRNLPPSVPFFTLSVWLFRHI